MLFKKLERDCNITMGNLIHLESLIEAILTTFEKMSKSEVGNMVTL